MRPARFRAATVRDRIPAHELQQMMAKLRPEGTFQDSLLAGATALGYAGYHVPDSRGTAPGYPDLWLVGHRALFVWETKVQRKSRDATADQAIWLRALAAVDGPPRVALARPEELDRLLDVLRRQARIGQLPAR